MSSRPSLCGGHRALGGRQRLPGPGPRPGALLWPQAGCPALEGLSGRLPVASEMAPLTPPVGAACWPVCWGPCGFRCSVRAGQAGQQGVWWGPERGSRV